MSKICMATLFGVWVISWVFVWCELTTPGSELMMLVLGFTGTIAIAKVQKLTEKLEAAEKQKKIYESGFAKNVFQQLDTECSLCVLGLCLASHDIVLHHSLIDKSEAGEKNYHFAASLSILREINSCSSVFFFFFKQKTAYEIYQCDWSSDVCSSDLRLA